MSLILLAHPTGNENVRAAARAFDDAGWLKEFHSCICWRSDIALGQLLPSSLLAHLNRRSFAEIPRHKQHSYPLHELLRLFSPQLPLLTRHETGLLSVDAIYRSFDRHVASRLSRSTELSAVYAYEDGALNTFRAAHRLGLSTLYELPIGYWRAARQIFEEESSCRPDWACTLPGLQDSPQKLARKDEELCLADRVIVPSSYVRSTLLDHQPCLSTISVVPYGAPPPVAISQVKESCGRLKVLFVGSLGQRKGLSYALEAIELLGQQVTLTLIGNPTARHCLPLDDALNRHRHMSSLPHAQILEQMRQHDVLLFPTLFDGFGLVITEALSQGLPVIATANSGAPECIRDGVDGFIVPIRDSQAIAHRLQQLVDNRDLLAEMRDACLCRAAQLSWSAYEKRLRMAVSLALQPTDPLL